MIVCPVCFLTAKLAGSGLSTSHEYFLRGAPELVVVSEDVLPNEDDPNDEEQEGDEEDEVAFAGAEEVGTIVIAILLEPSLGGGEATLFGICLPF